MLDTSRLTASVNVQPDYIPTDDKREFWMEVRRGVCTIETAVNKRLRTSPNRELSLVAKIVTSVRRDVSAHLGLE